jgi:hypothetical protein
MSEFTGTECTVFSTPEIATVNMGAYVPTERLCIFCAHFRWTKEEMWGMGSTMTGPMMEGGWAECAKKRFKDLEAPDDEADFRRVIMQATGCPDYLPPEKK